MMSFVLSNDQMKWLAEIIVPIRWDTEIIHCCFCGQGFMTETHIFELQVNNFVHYAIQQTLRMPSILSVTPSRGGKEHTIKALPLKPSLDDK